MFECSLLTDIHMGPCGVRFESELRDQEAPCTSVPDLIWGGRQQLKTFSECMSSLLTHRGRNLFEPPVSRYELGASWHHRSTSNYPLTNIQKILSWSIRVAHRIALHLLLPDFSLYTYIYINHLPKPEICGASYGLGLLLKPPEFGHRESCVQFSLVRVFVEGEGGGFKRILRRTPWCYEQVFLLLTFLSNGKQGRRLERKYFEIGFCAMWYSPFRWVFWPQILSMVGVKVNPRSHGGKISCLSARRCRPTR